MNLSLAKKIILCVALILILGFLSGFFAGAANTDWYTTLNKPSFQPPPSVFGPAWTILYILIGVSIGLIWHKGIGHENFKLALKLFGFQFLLNLIWSPVFFKFQQPLLALIIIIVLWLFITWTIKVFFTIHKPAGYLLIPYLMWVTFATLLNASIVYLN